MLRGMSYRINNSLTFRSLPAFALGTIVTIGILGRNLEMFMAVCPVFEMTIMQAADRFLEASATDCNIKYWRGKLS